MTVIAIMTTFYVYTQLTKILGSLAPVNISLIWGNKIMNGMGKVISSNSKDENEIMIQNAIIIGIDILLGCCCIYLSKTWLELGNLHLTSLHTFCLCIILS